ncbi:MAG: hypothetical protein KDG55_03980 [Rhodocyclaceae bacterium]|nr:hypothetical protein [Rhodocyclaceae bacterium]
MSARSHSVSRRTCHRPTTRALLPWLVGLWAAAALPAHAESVESVLARVQGAYGSPPRFAALRATGRTHSVTRGDGPMQRQWAAPDRFQIRLDYPGGTELRSLAGDRAWQGERPMGEAFVMAMRLQAARALLPWNLLAPDAPVSYFGSRPASDGTRLDILILNLAPPLRLLVDVEGESGRIVRASGLGIGNLEFATEYGDFRQIDGHLVATREAHFAMGHAIGYSTIESVNFFARAPNNNGAR